jgi:hypothetical protein
MTNKLAKSIFSRFIPGRVKFKRKKINGSNSMGRKAVITNEKPCK